MRLFDLTNTQKYTEWWVLVEQHTQQYWAEACEQQKVKLDGLHTFPVCINNYWLWWWWWWCGLSNKFTYFYEVTSPRGWTISFLSSLFSLRSSFLSFLHPSAWVRLESMSMQNKFWGFQFRRTPPWHSAAPRTRNTSTLKMRHWSCSAGPGMSTGLKKLLDFRGKQELDFRCLDCFWCNSRE